MPFNYYQYPNKRNMNTSSLFQCVCLFIVFNDDVLLFFTFFITYTRKKIRTILTLLKKLQLVYRNRDIVFSNIMGNFYIEVTHN